MQNEQEFDPIKSIEKKYDTLEQKPSYLDVLNPEQYQAVVHEGKSLLILAGAGSGKTRVITTKIAYLIGQKNVNPRSILAVTFTKKAADEMRERAVALEPLAADAQIRTFHSFGAYFLRVNAEAAGVDPNFTVYDDDDSVTLLSKAVVGLTKGQSSKYAHKISLAKDYCLLPDDPETADLDSDPEFPGIYRAYEKRLRETGNCDFGDLIMLPYLALKNNPNLRARTQRRFQVIMVDEYQDSNTAQFKLLQALSGAEEGSGTYVCVVGDDDQSIYKFRGAEIKNILTFKDKFPGTDIIRLERNYRSTEEILRVADSVVSNNGGRLGKNLRSERGKGKKPVLAFLQNQEQEAEFTGDLIEETHKMGVPYSDWAVLYRMNAQSLEFESEFLHRKIPYEIVGSLKFYEREEIKDLLSYLSLIANPRDEIAFRRIVNKPARGIGLTSQEKIIDAAREAFAAGEETSITEKMREIIPDFSKKAREGGETFLQAFDAVQGLLKTADSSGSDTAKLSELVEAISEKSGLLEYHKDQDEISGTQRAANMQELANSAVLYPCTREGLLEFLDHIELDRTLEKTDSTDETDRVTLITLHNTKGLEFPRVVITGMELGVFPRQDKTGGDLEEERRLFYVGITRAQNELYFTSCSQRRMYGRNEYSTPSPFLLEMGQDNVKIIGHKPSSFMGGGFHGGDFGGMGLSNPDLNADPLMKKYSRGAKIYHDDYGYGIITSGHVSDEGEYVVTIRFENGGIKRFLPKYQEGALMVVKD